MTKLYIDNHLADLDPATDLAISLGLESLDSATLGAVCTKSITIPSTPRNRALMGECENPCNAQMFNHEEHRARVEVDGCVVLEGRLHLTASAGGKGGYYRFVVVGESAEWRKSLDVPIGSLLADWSEEVTKSEITSGWSRWESLVRFFPLSRGTGKGLEHHRGRILPENIHPFIHLGSLLREMFAKAGYAVESSFFYSDLFNSLYMSGRWSERKWEDWKSKMDFKAVRTEDSPTVKAHTFGRVFASPLKYFNTVGNLVELPTSSAKGAFNAGSLSVEESTGRLCFTPTTPLLVAFDYHLRWRTQYRIANRQELVGLSGVRFRISDSEPIPLANDFHDYRAEGLDVGYAYNLIIFDMTEGTTYRLLADEVLERSAEGEVLRVKTHELLSTDQRSTHFQHTLSAPLCNLRLAMVLEGTELSPITDWAIYDGVVTEYGTTELEVDLRSQPVECAPDNPVYFDDFYFEGGEKDMEVTVLEGCSIQPVFYPHPSLIGTLSWGDIADVSFTGMELLLALQEMFDLHIQTNPQLRTVRIEPRGEFWEGAEIIDLSERLDLSEPIVVEELGDDQKRTLRLAYRSGDKAVEEWEKQSGERFGEWNATIDNLFAEEGTRNLESRLFTASLSEQGAVATAPSVSLIIAQSNDSSTPRCVQRLNFPTKIVSFRGTRKHQSGESFGFPQKSDKVYPLVTFFDDGSLGGEPRSLLFEDRDGVEGLHSWWSDRLEELNRSHRITARVFFAPEDIERFVSPSWLGRDFGALYMLTVEGERVLCRLEKICSYNPNEQSTKAVFVTV